jgi:FMN-dependent oxidoreductase (nitrilotriacetate monooxygenase family)
MRQMHLGIMVYPTGQHISAWRLPEAEPHASSENLKQQIWIAQTAERGKFDMLFFADALSTGPNYHPSTIVRLEPITLLSALAMATSHIGLAATATTTYTEPYNLARLLGSLDHISGGRAAWNVITSSLAGTADNFGRIHPPHDERYVIALEFIDVLKGLWDSWDDGAVVIDKASGVYADPAGMHPLNHQGKYFSVTGALNLSRPPQGYPVIIQAGSSEAGRDVAAQIAEVIFTVHEDKAAAKDFVDDIHARAQRHGRDPASVKIMPGVCPIIAENEQAARRKFSEMAAFQDSKVALKVLSDRLGVPLDGYDLDAPLPDLPLSDGMRGHAATLTAMARRDKLTLRQLRDLAAGAMGHRMLFGSPEQIADGLEDWFTSGAADGFNLMPSSYPTGLADFVDHVVPILQDRGLFRRDYTGTTLRDHLGLARPDSRYKNPVDNHGTAAISTSAANSASR